MPQPESFINLSDKDRSEALAVASEATRRPVHLLEKDVWVVWSLHALFESPLGKDLTFKGGTSLSKAYGVIDRFSEDIDLTYDICELISDRIVGSDPIPPTYSQAKRWTEDVRERLPVLIAEKLVPIIEQAAKEDGALLEVAFDGVETVTLDYQPLAKGTGYVAPQVRLEFGARSTGEPHEIKEVTCDMDQTIKGVSFPTASPRVMKVMRTFWEKATAAHVYHAKRRLGNRLSRHWYDLAKIAKSDYFDDAIRDRDLAVEVARHKSMFFRTSDVHGSRIDYLAVVSGDLKLVPKGEHLEALGEDYRNMQADGLLPERAMTFDSIMSTCADIENAVCTS